MRVRDTVVLLRELDPAVPAAAPARRPAVRAGGRGRVLALAGLCAALGVIAGVGAPGREPGLAAAAHAALSAPDRIVHLRLRSHFHAPADDLSTAEVWMRDGGRQLRVVFDGGAHELVRDQGRRFAASYVRHRHEVTVFTDPDVVEARPPDELTFGGPEGAARMAEQLPALLARARDGDPAIRRLPDAEIAGRPAGRFELTAMSQHATTEPRGDAAPGLEVVPVRTVVWLDLDSHLPRRIERFGPRGQPESTTDVLLAERLAPGAATERLLGMPSRPGAERRVQSSGHR